MEDCKREPSGENWLVETQRRDNLPMEMFPTLEPELDTTNLHLGIKDVDDTRGCGVSLFVQGQCDEDEFLDSVRFRWECAGLVKFAVRLGRGGRFLLCSEPGHSQPHRCGGPHPCRGALL